MLLLARRILVLAFATQLPDVVDKSLAWYLGVLPNGRSLAHSLLIATVVIGIGYRIAAYGRRDLAAAGAIGYLSHLGADAL